MLSSAMNRKYIENEFENAVFDETTGLSVEEMRAELKRRQDAYTEAQSRPLFCAECYAYLLDNARLCVNEHTPFSVKFDIGVDYTYFARPDIYDAEIFQAQCHRVLEEKYPDDFKKMLERHECGMGLIWTDFWHTVPDWDHLLKTGFTGILSEARAAREALLKKEHTDAQADYLAAVILFYEAMLRMMKRMRDYAAGFDVPQFVKGMDRLLVGAPQTMYEVMLFSVLYLYFEEIGCERARTLGPIDRTYLPYYEYDLAHGVTDEEEREYFRYFCLHFTATKRFAEQPLTLGGGDENGNPYVTPLTAWILDVYDGLSIYDPKIHFRYCRGMDEALLLKIADMIRRGHSSICVICDETVYKGYERLGIPRADAKDYVLLGCYEPTIMGKEDAEIGITWLNTVKCLEYALSGGIDILTGKRIAFESDPDHASFDALLDAFFAYLDEALEFAIDFSERQSEYAVLVNPSPVYSSSFTACLEAGKDVHEYPLQYHNMSLKCYGLATVVDSLTAIKKYVYDEKALTLAEMREALYADWCGYEEIRARILADRDKYGCGRELPDGIMRRVTTYLADKYCGRRVEKRGGKLRLGLDSIYKCVDYGEKTAATPDGRKARTPVSKNLCASVGMDREGITGFMRSVLQIDATAFLNSAIFDYVLHPSAVEGERGLAAFAALMRVFFENGGFAMQGNILNAEDLKKAKEHPEQYATLQVRVCGWNEYFVKLSEVKQDMFIRQCEGM